MVQQDNKPDNTKFTSIGRPSTVKTPAEAEEFIAETSSESRPAPSANPNRMQQEKPTSNEQIK